MGNSFTDRILWKTEIVELLRHAEPPVSLPNIEQRSLMPVDGPNPLTLLFPKTGARKSALKSHGPELAPPSLDQ